MANDWRPNPGYRPDDVAIHNPETGEPIGTHRVHVRLFNGWTSEVSGSWPADRGTVWKINQPRHPFNIKDYKLAE